MMKSTRGFGTVKRVSPKGNRHPIHYLRKDTHKKRNYDKRKYDDGSRERVDTFYDGNDYELSDNSLSVFLDENS